MLPTLEGWIREGRRASLGTVVRTQRSAPRLPGSVMAVSESGEVAGSVTGGCVEPAVYIQSEEVLQGGPPRLASFGYADEDAMEVGLPCGGSVDVFIEPLDAGLVARVAEAVGEERPIAYVTAIGGDEPGRSRVVEHGEGGDEVDAAVRPLLALGRSEVVEVDGTDWFVSSIVPRPDMYVFGAIDFASSLARLGRFMGYRVTVCDPRAIFVTPARFPDADELVTEWPQEFIARAPVDERTAICVLTHDQKLDVPALLAALKTPAGYIGAMGSRNTTDRRRAALVAEGVTEEELARVHAPIGLSIGGKTPEEVAIAIGAEIVQVANAARPVERAGAGRA
ncbi:MAG TPA: XdhC/CoxI family protein [Miltoncostaeaceae bacterium]|nr:XdhC/CoxI family protein [Miltoncostaeaceae bacterium]